MESWLSIGRGLLLLLLFLTLGLNPLEADKPPVGVSPCPLRDPGPNSGWVRVPKDVRSVAEAVYIAAQQGLYRVWIGSGLHPLVLFPPLNVPEDVPLAGLYLDESFIICGMGPDFTVVRANERVPPPLIDLIVDEGEVVLEGFTLTGGGWRWEWGSTSIIPPGLEVRGRGSRFILRNLRVFSTRSSEGISISAPSSEVLLERVEVHGMTSRGMELSHGEIVLADSLISGNGLGAVIKWEAEVTITQSRIGGNNYRGILTDGRPRITILDSEIAYNGGDGIDLRGDTYLEVNDTRIFANEGYGIKLFAEPCWEDVRNPFEGEIHGRGNEIFDNAKGDLCPEDFPWPEGFRRP